TVAISHDRQHWQAFDTIPVRRGWDGIALADDARYVRLSLAPDARGALPSLAEVTVYGSEQAHPVAKATDRRHRSQAQPAGVGGTGQDVVETAQKAKKGGNGGKEKGKGPVQISTKPGETHCSGKKAKCEAKKGQVSVEQDCASSGSCVIDVQANGGAA